MFHEKDVELRNVPQQLVIVTEKKKNTVHGFLSTPAIFPGFFIDPGNDSNVNPGPVG